MENTFGAVGLASRAVGWGGGTFEYDGRLESIYGSHQGATTFRGQEKRTWQRGPGEGERGWSLRRGSPARVGQSASWMRARRLSLGSACVRSFDELKMGGGPGASASVPFFQLLFPRFVSLGHGLGSSVGISDFVLILLCVVSGHPWKPLASRSGDG